MKKIRPYNPKTPVSTRGSYNHRRTLEEYARREQELIDQGKLDPEEAESIKSGCYFVAGLILVILTILGYLI